MSYIKSDEQLKGMSKLGGTPLENPQDFYLDRVCKNLGIDKEDLRRLGMNEKAALIAFLSSSIVEASGV